MKFARLITALLISLMLTTAVTDALALSGL